MKIVRLLCCCLLLLLLGSLAAVWLPGAALAQSENTTPAQTEAPLPPPEAMDLNPTYPRMEANAGGSFSFEVMFTFQGPRARVFDLRATAPQGWEVYLTPQYEATKKVSSITLQPSYTGVGDKLILVANAPVWPIPDPGEYKITLEAISNGPKASTTLTAVIINLYTLKTVSANDRYNTSATTGKDNYFSIKVQNLGTAAVDGINLSASSKPEGWTVEFKPDKIDSLNALDEKTVDVNIKPPTNTIAGDYMISLRASGKQAAGDEMSIRVTVESPTIWGWVGVVIILVVVAGLIVIFMRFSRR